MADLSITNTFVANTTASAVEVNQNFTDISTWLNNRNNALDRWGLIDVNGIATFRGVTTVSGQLIAKGTTSGDSASSGYIGENVSSSVISNQNFPSTTVWGDLTSITLTAGDWDLCATMHCNTNTSSATTEFNIGIGAHSGTDTSGLDVGSNYFVINVVASSSNKTYPIYIPRFSVSISSTVIYYLKYCSIYSSGQPVASGKISARRMR